jgi:tetratricopeptide (TPR) repeat protein
MATLFVAVAGAGVGRCDLVDSIAGVLQAAPDRLEPGDARLLALTLGRCRNDWPSNYEVARARAAAFPGSSNYQWVLAAQARRAKRPTEAAAILQAIDPERSLGWMSDRGKVIYWRELAAAQHAVGDFRGELATAERMDRLDPGRLSAGYVRARSLVGSGRADEALRNLRALENIAPDPAMVVSEIAGRLRPVALGTPGWVHYQVALELMAHGHHSAGRIAAERAVEWFQSRPPEEAARHEHRLIHAQSLELLDRLDEAAVVFRALVSEDPSNVDFRGGLGVVATRLGHHDEALATDRWLAELPERNSLGLPTLYRARIAAVMGDPGQALSFLEELPYGSHPVDPLFFHTDPALQSLQDQPRFVSLVRNRD